MRKIVNLSLLDIGDSQKYATATQKLMFERIEEVRNYLFKYLEARLELIKTETQERIENIVIQLIYLVVLLILASLTCIFLFIIIAVGINEWLDSRYAGFLIMFGLLLLITFFWIKAGKWVQKSVRQLLFWVFKHK
ncbi:phage holin family protein [Runella sp.]|uniref:phage holin family protein n=1 Tax=Runella sp. TaxID=1960881 RepID=UPI003D13887F